MVVSSGLVTHFADLYSLDIQGVSQLDRMGDKSSENLLSAIEASKASPLARVIAALGFRHVGARASEVLSARLGSIQAICRA